MSGCTLGDAFALSSLVVISESGDVLRAGYRASVVECWSTNFSCCLRYVFTARATDSKKNCGTKRAREGKAFNFLGKMVPPARFQRATSRLGGERSMQLSYGSTGEESYHVNPDNHEILWKAVTGL
jgi:hypothetical protein